MQIGSRELGVSTESTRLELSVRLWTPQCARERVCTRYKSQSLVLRTSHAAALLQRNGGSPARRPEPVDHPRAEKVSLDPKEAPEGTFPADTMTNNNVRFVQHHPLHMHTTHGTSRLAARLPVPTASNSPLSSMLCTASAAPAGRSMPPLRRHADAHTALSSCSARADTRRPSRHSSDSSIPDGTPRRSTTRARRSG